MKRRHAQFNDMDLIEVADGITMGVIDRNKDNAIFGVLLSPERVAELPKDMPKPKYMDGEYWIGAEETALIWTVFSKEIRAGVKGSSALALFASMLAADEIVKSRWPEFYAGFKKETDRE